MGTIGFGLALLLVAPRVANAGMGEWIDVIVGLSGPQMVGVPLACEVILKQEKEKACYIAGFPVPWPKPGQDDAFFHQRDQWLSFGGGVYASTGTDSEAGGYEAYDVWLLAFEPTVNVRSLGRKPRQGEDRKFKMEHGAGLSLFYMFGRGIDGKDFDAFANGGIKLRPVALTWRNITPHLDRGVAYNLRIFPQRFTAQDFGADGTGTTTDEGAEYVQGFSITVSF
jgi:hypothetical protein